MLTTLTIGEGENVDYYVEHELLCLHMLVLDWGFTPN